MNVDDWKIIFDPSIERLSLQYGVQNVTEKFALDVICIDLSFGQTGWTNSVDRDQTARGAF